MNDLLGQKPKILVIGDLIIDHYLWGFCNRISPEAPVQIIDVNHESTLLGGAGNVVNNLNSLGAQVDLISVIGECDVSLMLEDLFSKKNLSSEYLIRQKGRIASKKTRIISEQQQVVRYDIENTDDISNQSISRLISIFKKIICNYDLVLLSDYDKGVLTRKVTQSLINISKENNKKILVDPKGNDYSKYDGAYLLTPNKKEASEATKITISDELSLEKSIQYLKKQYNLDISIITLSEHGVAIFDDELRVHPTAAREVYDVTGAGDTILASIGFAISCGKNIDEAVKFANLASGIVVGKVGSATATIDEIIEYESGLTLNNSKDHIKSFDQISSIVKELKIKNKKIIFTNGCFDILHLGHVRYLEDAKKLGDILIVGLNSDRSTKLLKGKDRPINSQNDRAYILASLEVIDYVVIFEDETPYDLITIIKPDILVKGSDYKGQKIVGEDIAKSLKLIDFVDGRSTSKTIKRIQNL